MLLNSATIFRAYTSGWCWHRDILTNCQSRECPEQIVFLKGVREWKWVKQVFVSQRCPEAGRSALYLTGLVVASLLILKRERSWATKLDRRHPPKASGGDCLTTDRLMNILSIDFMRLTKAALSDQRFPWFTSLFYCPNAVFTKYIQLRSFYDKLTVYYMCSVINVPVWVC